MSSVGLGLNASSAYGDCLCHRWTLRSEDLHIGVLKANWKTLVFGTERRVSADGSGAYTRAEYQDFYGDGSQAFWDRAQPDAGAWSLALLVRSVMVDAFVC